MFSLLVKSGGWDEHVDWLTTDRVFEYTAESLVQRFKPGGVLASDLVRTLPAFLVPEVGSDATQLGRVAQITGFRTSPRRVGIEYLFNPEYPPVPMAEIERLADQLDIGPFEFRRTHWAIKDVDLLLVLGAGKTRLSESSALIAADTLLRWRERALNLVEELAAECLRSDEDETRAAGHLALAAVEGLRPYAGTGLERPDRRAAWGGVIAAVVDFVPMAAEARRLADAVRQLARAYGLGPSEDTTGRSIQN